MTTATEVARELYICTRQRDVLLAALQAVVGHGYCEQRHPAGQDLVSKDAIAQVRAAIAKAEG